MTNLAMSVSYTGEEWQDLCVRVLHEHHAAPSLIEVPDGDRGDAGLEAFSLDGCAYQCYAPENDPMLSTKTRYEKQRDKMTTDLNKFVNNAEKIQKLIPPDLRIKYWILLVPTINTRSIVEHSRTKTVEVRQACLPYAAPDITIVAQTLASYPRAREAVVRRQLDKLALPLPEPIDYSNLADDLVKHVDSKLAHTSAFSDAEKRSKLVSRLMKNYVVSRGYRDHIRDQYSELGDDLEKLLDDIEERLSLQYALDQPVPDRRLTVVLKDTEEAVNELLNTRSDNGREIAEGQVADWLMRCPLDFA
ncbi:hypothetical protein APR12_002170 [Nocardia amikacinitolerans]|uniref:hypothetical protein n=1 Tax=Nocardia amikacinitolerans TaxID=756689 RepID=UPI000A7B0BAA|nr:hypothetical protein [Nocardia amikacinitolerans]MCP2316830.1 hypothetical protein [Nocardia amikacinitolerans]